MATYARLHWLFAVTCRLYVRLSSFSSESAQLHIRTLPLGSELIPLKRHTLLKWVCSEPFAVLGCHHMARSNDKSTFDSEFEPWREHSNHEH
jgi:hypothetical protein